MLLVADSCWFEVHQNKLSFITANGLSISGAIILTPDFYGLLF